MQKEYSKLKEIADYIMKCNTLGEVMKGIAIGISSSIYDNDIQKEALDYLEKNHVFFQRLESIQEQQMRKVAFNLKQNS
jgi:hypothetical protein